MKRQYALAAFVLVAACSAAPPAPAPPVLADRTIVVLPANNRTGDALLISGASILEKYALRSDRFTVPDALTAEARQELAHRGYTVVAPESVDAAIGDRVPVDAHDAATLATQHHLAGTVLYIELRRWEVDVPFHPAYVIASVEATLIDASTGRVVWSADHPSRPIATQGVVILGEAYSIAAHEVMAELLAPLGPQQAPSP